MPYQILMRIAIIVMFLRKQESLKYILTALDIDGMFDLHPTHLFYNLAARVSAKDILDDSLNALGNKCFPIFGSE